MWIQGLGSQLHAAQHTAHANAALKATLPTYAHISTLHALGTSSYHKTSCCLDITSHALHTSNNPTAISNLRMPAVRWLFPTSTLMPGLLLQRRHVPVNNIVSNIACNIAFEARSV